MMKKYVICLVGACALSMLALAPSLAKTAIPAPKPLKPGAVITLKTMAFPLSTGLYINVNITNRTLAPLRIVFPSAARVEVQAFQDGCPLWDSLAGQRFTQSLTTLLLQGEQIDTFSQFWPFKAGTIGGKIVLRARLLTTPPLAAQPIVVDLPLTVPSPQTSSSPQPQSTDSCATPLPAPTGQIRTLPQPERRRPE